MIIFKTGRLLRDEYSFNTLKRFDGSVISGDGFCTVIPISSADHREGEDYKRLNGNKQVPFVRLWKGETHTEFRITDDWDEDSILLIPNEMQELIESSKAAILENKIPCNFG